jgi:penicillin-insensitive murein endopeptidase
MRWAAHMAAGCSLALICCAFGAAKGAALDHTQPTRVTPARTASLSSGLPWDGRLQRAVRLCVSAILRPVAECASRGNFYGTSELVSLLERTARTVAARWPGSQLSVGELSASKGGKIDGHHSHRSGRDADVAFFMRDERGRNSQFRRFVTFGSEGVARGSQRKLYFDDARNWAAVSAMLRDPDARVQYIFVAQSLRTRLLMEGRRRGETDQFLRTAAAVMVEPQEGHKHANHFHVRIYCPRDDRPECQDSAPYWPWYDGTPPDGQHAELPVIRWRTPSAAMQPSAAPPRASSTPRSI